MPINKTHHLICAWSGPLFAALFGIGFWLIAGFLPPHPPSADAEQIAAIYREHTILIRLGQVIMLLGFGIGYAWIAEITHQLRRVEGEDPVLSTVQLVAGSVGVLLPMLAVIFWTAAAFRPERAPEITQLANDFAWFIVVMPFSAVFVQAIAIGLAVLSDRHSQPLFPRWIGYLNLWVAVLLIPGALVAFFRTGPFAWNGLLAFWLPVGVFFLWLVVMSAQMIANVRRM